jgi:hypothetical protein
MREKEVLTIDDMANYYSRLPTTLLFLLEGRPEVRALTGVPLWQLER